MTKNANQDRDSEIERLASLVVSEGITVAVAATRLGWSCSKSYALSRTATYRKAKSAKLLEIADSSIRLVLNAESAAVATLMALLGCEDPQVAVSAAKGLLSHGGRAIASVERLQAEANQTEAAEKAAASNNALSSFLDDMRFGPKGDRMPLDELPDDAPEDDDDAE